MVVTVFPVVKQTPLNTAQYKLPVYSSFYQKMLQWFNTTYNSTFRLTTEEILFGIPTVCTTFRKKINYTIMFLRYYIYKRKLQDDSLSLHDFINKIDYKYKLEKLI